MSTGWILIAMGTVFAVIDLLMARRLLAITPEDLARKPDPKGRTAEQLNMLGKLMLVLGAFAFFLFLALGLGWIPAGFEPASFN